MKRLMIGLAIVAVVVIVIAWRIASRQETAPAQGIEEIQAEQGIPVDAVTVSRDVLTVTREISGEVSGWRQTNLSPAADRKVGSVHVREGDRITRGAVILSFDVSTSPDQMTQLAQLEEAQQNAERQVNRLRPLFEKGAISESDLDAAQTRLVMAEASLRDARLQVDMVSPISGIVTLVAVSPGDAVVAGQTVAQVASLDSMRVTAAVAAEVARELRPGAEARVTLGRAGGAPEPLTAAGTPGAITGRLTRVALGADPTTRLYTVEAVLANPARHLRPGEYVTLAVATSRVPDALILPRIALIGETEAAAGAAQQVYRVRDGRAELCDIRLGVVTEDVVQATEGLEAGDRVVIFGANRLQNGAKVRFHELDGTLMKAPASTPATAPATEPAAGEEEAS